MRIPGFEGLTPLDVAKHAVKDFFADDMMTYAAALAFHVMLALFPFVIFLLTLLGALGLSEFFDWLLEQGRAGLPPDAMRIVSQVITEIQAQNRGGLLSVSILIAIWAASSGVRSLMTSLNVAYDVVETRPAWKRFPLSIVYTIGLAILLIAVTGVMLLGPQATQWLADRVGLTSAVATVWTVLRWPLLIALMLLTVAIIYYVSPDIEQPFRYVTPGSVIAVLVWIAASLGFSYYVDTFGNYGATYGSLGGMIVLLLYFFVSGAVLLLGAEVNAAILRMHQAELARDSTVEQR